MVVNYRIVPTDTGDNFGASLPFDEESLSKVEVGSRLYYMVNPLVPPLDGSRIIGPLSEDQLINKREMYERISSRLSDEDRREHLLSVFSLERIE